MDEVKKEPEKKPEPEKIKPAEKPEVKKEKLFEYRWELDINGKKIFETKELQIDYTREKGNHLVPRTRRLG